MSIQRRSILIICFVIGLLICMALLAQSRFNTLPQLMASIGAKQDTPFPKINEQILSKTQYTIISTAKKEYEAQPPGTKYAEGIKESWCADFVSWVYKQSGIPFSNPNSGSWRIPGTYTLRDYFESNGRFKSANSGYVPKPGDVMLYDNPSKFGQHTNIVISIDNKTIITVGGNESGGRIRVQSQPTSPQSGLVGYGVLNP